MPRQKDIFARLKRTLGVFSSSPVRVDRPADPLVKQNLPPLMGRRDAAADRIGDIMTQDIFSWREERRCTHYRDVGALLDSVIVDTRFILSMLSSPDTESREKKLCGYFSLLRDIVRSVDELCKVGIGIFRELDERTSGLLSAEELAGRDEQTVSESEIFLVNLCREFSAAAAPKLARYRAYAAKSFSEQNLQRYNNSYHEYAELFRDVGR